ncbi:hypothetical protein DFH94DRAFT_707233 [Russula ochroleuca]|uniref:Uncharacterized protein n=1 Tax=Russula ochroleuca TaxID=152965 RepID=A0A9P5N472_9AGAM|nr:hypothetical protein DFH94DRAFT_707233 [Russula ochroleuca]
MYSKRFEIYAKLLLTPMAALIKLPQSDALPVLPSPRCRHSSDISPVRPRSTTPSTSCLPCSSMHRSFPFPGSMRGRWKSGSDMADAPPVSEDLDPDDAYYMVALWKAWPRPYPGSRSTRGFGSSRSGVEGPERPACCRREQERWRCGEWRAGTPTCDEAFASSSSSSLVA